MLKALLLSLALLAPFVSHAEPADSWNQLRALYDSGKLDDAALLLKQNPKDDAAYYFDLGTIYLRTQRPGLALPYLEIASRLNPLDSDIRHNLEVARTSLGRAIGSDRLDPSSTPLELVADRLAIAPIRAIVSFLGAILLLLSLKSYRRARSVRQWAAAGIGPVGAAILFAALLFGVAPRWIGARPAFATERLVLKSGPGEQFLELGNVEAGVKLRVLDSAQAAAASGAPSAAQDNLWYQVRYSSEGVGWVPASRLLIL